MQSTAPASLRLLGQATLCGVLFVAYQSKSDVRGEYMLCVLFKSYLLLAIPKHGSTKYMVMAILSLRDTQINEADNGRGELNHFGGGPTPILMSYRLAVSYGAILLEIGV